MSGLQSAYASAIRLRLRLLRCPLVQQPHVSLSLALPRAFASWGILHRQGIWPGRLLLSSTAQRPLSARPVCERAPDGLHRSMCPFSVTVGRHSTPRPSHRVETTCLNTTWPNGDVSRLGLPVSRSAGYESRRLRAFVEHPVPSHLLGAVTASG